MSNFKVGEKVVCVEPTDNLIKGEIYTISAFLTDFSGNLGVRLSELDFEQFNHAYRVSRFRKLDIKFSEDICAQLIADAKRETILN